MDKVIDVICYLANSKDVTNLFKVKMMKLLWYIDAFVYGNNPDGKDVPEESNNFNNFNLTIIHILVIEFRE